MLHKRLTRLEQEFGLPEDEAQACASRLARIREEEQRTVRLNQEMAQVKAFE